MSNRIRAIRKQRKMTMQDLAREVGTSQQQIDRLEKGHRKLTIEWLDRITKCLECDIYDVLPDSFSKRDIMMTSKAKVVGKVMDGGAIAWFDEDNEAYHIIFGRLDKLQEAKLFALVMETHEVEAFPSGSELVFTDLKSIGKRSDAPVYFVYTKYDIERGEDVYYFHAEGEIPASSEIRAVLVKSIKNEKF